MRGIGTKLVGLGVAIVLMGATASCSSGGDDTSASPNTPTVTIEFLFDISNQSQTVGTFEVTEGASEFEM